MDYALDVEITEKGVGKGVVVAIDINKVLELAITEFLKDIGLANLTCPKEYERLAV